MSSEPVLRACLYAVPRLGGLSATSQAAKALLDICALRFPRAYPPLFLREHESARSEQSGGGPGSIGITRQSSRPALGSDPGTSFGYAQREQALWIRTDALASLRPGRYSEAGARQLFNFSKQFAV